MNLNTIHRKIKNLVGDLEALQNGEWLPDEDSIEASLDAAIMVEAAFPLIHDMAEMLSDIYEWLETGKVDGCTVDRSAILDDMQALSNRMEAHE